jgi:hypothetical protein
VSLHAEVARYQRQLSDSVNCASAKTLEGKAHIQELSSKISAAQQRIKQIEAEKAPGNDHVALSSNAGGSGDTYTKAGTAAHSSNPEQGSLVSVFA